MTDDNGYLDSQFAAYRNELINDVTPVGPAAVRATVRHRRRVAVTTGAVIALALIAGPAAGYAALSRGPAPPVPGTTPGPTLSTSPTPPTTPPPSPSASATGTAAPQSQITRSELLKAKVTLVDWWGDAPCTTEGRLGGAAPQDSGNWLEALDHADVDKDGTAEAVATIQCVFGGNYTMRQVAVFDRDAAGKIITMGQVLSDRPPTLNIQQVDTRADGSVRVQVSDLLYPADRAQKQWRTYTWNGSGFAQTGGPTSFPSNSRLADLRVTATDVVFNGTSGTTTVTIHNAGPADVESAFLWFEFHRNPIVNQGTGWSRCEDVGTDTNAESNTITCELGPIPAGETVTLDLGLSRNTAALDGSAALAQVLHWNKQQDQVPDIKEADNQHQFNVR